MKSSKFSESQIINILKLAQSGMPITEVCRSNGISSATFYKWHSKYGGMDASMLSKVKQLEADKNRLKRMYVELQMDHAVPKRGYDKLLNCFGDWSITILFKYVTARQSLTHITVRVFR